MRGSVRYYILFLFVVTIVAVCVDFFRPVGRGEYYVEKHGEVAIIHQKPYYSHHGCSLYNPLIKKPRGKKLYFIKDSTEIICPVCFDETEVELMEVISRYNWQLYYKHQFDDYE